MPAATPDERDHAAAALWGKAVPAAAPPLRAFRFLDLELDLREQDAARGRKRPTPPGHASWTSAEAQHRLLAEDLLALGVRPADLRPPGATPYPPTGPRETSWSH